MTTPNRSWIEKADLALADLTAGGGILQPAQAKKFIRLMIRESKLLQMVTVTGMPAPKHQFSKIKFGSRILRPGREAVAVAPADRVKPDLSFVELDAQLFKGEVRLSDEVLEDNLERGDFRQTVMEMIAEGAARDLEELVINGNTASADPFLAALDGVLVQARSNIVDATGLPLAKGMFTDMLKVLPSEHLRSKKQMRFLTSVDAELNYRNLLADRATVVGDKFLEGDAPILVSGVPLEAIPFFPENLGPANNQTNTLLTDPKNIIVGILRQIRLESARDISEGTMKVVVTLRVAVKYMDESACTKLINVRAA